MPQPDDLVKTGIHGLDDILLGGIPRGNVVVVTGSPGTGKTTLGIEFIYRGAREFDEPGVIVTFEVSAEKLVRDAAQFGWDLRELERQGRLKVIATTRRVFQQEVQEPDSLLLSEAAAIGARRIFVDGLAGMARNGNGDAREVFHILVEALHRESITAMFALDAPVDRAAVGAMPEDFIADTIIRLGLEPVRRAVDVRAIARVMDRVDPAAYVMRRGRLGAEIRAALDVERDRNIAIRRPAEFLHVPHRRRYMYSTCGD